MSNTISLPQLCREAGISDVTGRRYFADYNPYRAERGHHHFTPEEKAAALALIETKRKRRCMNRYNSSFIENDRALALVG